jgi:hypothetical protein
VVTSKKKMGKKISKWVAPADANELEVSITRPEEYDFDFKYKVTLMKTCLILNRKASKQDIQLEISPDQIHELYS